MNEQEVGKEFLVNTGIILDYIEGEDLNIRSVIEPRNHHRISDVELLLQKIESLRSKLSVSKKVKNVQKSSGQDDKE